MDFAYNYTALNSSGQLLKGLVFAPSRGLALARLKQGGFTPRTVSLAILASVSGALRSSFDTTELARFYKTLGRRVRNGKQMADGLEAASEYIRDPRLSQAVRWMRQAILDGQTEFEAMRLAGFPRRDCLIIRSVSESGKTGETFESMGAELIQATAVRRSIAATFRLPAILAVAMVGFIWTALVFVAPSTLAFLKQTGLKLNFGVFLTKYFEFVALFNSSVVISSAIYFSAFIGMGFYLRSASFKKLLDHWKLMRNLSLKSDHAALWNSFCLLYDAGIASRDAAKIVGDAARRVDSRQAFHRMGRQVEAGRSLEDAIQTAGFPDFVVTNAVAAVSSGDTVLGLREMVGGFEEDVTVLSSILQENAKVGSMLALGAGLFVVFLMTYYPMLASVLSNV